MSKQRLGNYIEEYSVKNKEDLGYPVYSVTNSQGFCTEYFSKDVSGKDKTKYKIVPYGYFAYNPSRINVGSIDWQGCEENVIVSPLYVVFKCNEHLLPEYLKIFLRSNQGLRMINNSVSGSVRNNLRFKVLSEFELNIGSLEEQKSVINDLDRIQRVIDNDYRLLALYDELTKARFVEMFGDLIVNSKRWEILPFTEIAKIDTNMIHDFSDYQDYPHIGIDSIEKETGILSGYRTVKEDGVISGKYLFTPEHIIYSKIRPNLNKVALPDFTGVCSADAYPILVDKNKCNREYLTYVLRSDAFLDYILVFSNRTNLPKVNKKQVESFRCPVPPIELQDRFRAFIKQVDKSKLIIKKRIEKYIELKEKMIERFYG